MTSDGAHTYGYDSASRLVSVDGGATASYAYDHQNRRHKKTVGSTVTHYVWQGYQVVAEHSGSTGALLVDYVYSGSRMISKVAAGSTNYFLSDWLSVRLTMDTGGSVVGRQAHLPFGEDFAESGTQEKHHLTSYERDSESSSDYAVNRQYSQSVGRFMRPDPFRGSCDSSNPQNWDRYSYSRNEPVNRSDPSGLDDISTIVKIPGWEWMGFLCAAIPELCRRTHGGPFEDGGSGFLEFLHTLLDSIFHTYHQNPTSFVKGSKKRCRYDDFACIGKSFPSLCGGSAEVTVAAGDQCPAYIRCLYVKDPISGLCHKVGCVPWTGPGNCT